MQLNNQIMTEDKIKSLMNKEKIILASEQPEISYEEACKNYRYFKSRTLKANAEEADFEKNMQYREFFLGIKKRYDMQFRAQKFRTKQKEEIAKLKQAVQEKTEKEESMTASLLGKREQPTNDDLQEQFEMMRQKIQKLEQQIEEKDKKYDELLQSQKDTSQQNTTITNNQNNMSQMDEDMLDNFSLKNQSEQNKPSPVILNFEQDIQF